MKMLVVELICHESRDVWGGGNEETFEKVEINSKADLRSEKGEAILEFMISKF